MKNNKKKKVFFITGGKTGGHIYPALSVALKLSEDENNNKVFYIGNKKNMEYELVKKYPQLQFLSIDFDGMPRKISLKLFLWGFKLIFSTLKSILYILKYNPDALLGTGGFITFPKLFAGYILNKPIMIHDCDTVPGLVSRVVSRFAKKVSLNFEEAKKYCQVALKSFPSSFDANYNMGILFYHLNKFEDAIYYFELAIKLEPKQTVEVYLNLSLVYELVQKEEDAIKILKDALNNIEDKNGLEIIKQNLRRLLKF